MTLPRRHIPGQVVMLTRRTVDRRFFLRPDTRMNGIVLFELARSSDRHDVPVHAHMSMINHNHTAVTDLFAQRAAFMRDFCAGIARAGNHKLRRRGAFWDNRPYCDTVLLDADAIERKLLYIWTNPVRAGLVRRAEDWPGVKILPRHWGKPMVVSKPQEGFYDPKKAEFIVFVPQPPPGYEDMTLEEVIEYFEELLREEEDRIARSRRKRGRRFRTPKWVLRQDPFGCPKRSSRMMGISPKFASRDGRLMARAQAAWWAFQNAYQTCRERWRDGDRETVFPCGTLKLRLEARVHCRGPDPGEPTLSVG